MSMNLAFRHKSGFLVEFPFQTSTKTSYKVMDNKDSRSKIMKLLANDLHYRNRHLTSWQKKILRECKNFIRDKNLTLIIV